jgi:hypothetical protein
MAGKAEKGQTDGMSEKLWKAVAALGGAAALFYALGFTVVQSYAYKNGFFGMFWLTKEFYRDAGATFILDLVRVPMLAPYIFFPLLLILLSLIPKDDKLRLFCGGEAKLSNRDWAKILVLFGIMVLTGVFALNYGALSGRESFAEFVDRLRWTEESTLPQPENSLAFCSLITPVMVVVAIFLYRCWQCLDRQSKRRDIIRGIFIFYFVFVSMIPITYGFYVYDLRVLPISDPQIQAELEGGEPTGMGGGIFFLGEFGDKYVFFRKMGNSIENKGIIETRNVQELKRLGFDIRRASSLRMLMTKDVPDQVKEKQKEQTMQWILEGLGKEELTK